MTKKSITAQIEELRKLPRGELIERYTELFQHEPRSTLLYSKTLHVGHCAESLESHSYLLTGLVQ